MFSFYDNTTSLGWDVNLTNDVITTRFNSDIVFELMSGNNIALKKKHGIAMYLTLTREVERNNMYIKEM
jgi:hypothetical protein